MLKRMGLLLVISSCLMGAATEAGTDSGYRIINTGFNGGGCWYDNLHFVVVQGHQTRDHKDFEVDGLYYLNPQNPSDLKRIDLSPIEPSIQKQIREVSCQDQTILFYWLDRVNQVSRLYGLKIGQTPEVIAELRWARPQTVSLKGRYVLGNSLSVDKGIWEEHKDCKVRYIKPGFRVLCWPARFEQRWPLMRFVLTEYRWEETIKVRGDDGKPKEVKNPKQPLRDSGGNPITFALLLRDLDNHVLANLGQDETWGIPAKAYGLLDISPDEKYLYTGCRQKGQRKGSGLDHVCRYPLDGELHPWEEVFAIDEEHVDHVTIELPSVSNAGDVLFVVRGSRHFPGIWRYSAKTKTINQVSHPSEYPGSFSVSPDGKYLAFVRREHGEPRLVLAIPKGDSR
jgi:hypothetical protein